MTIYIVIPAHNEQEAISKTLQSLVEQTILPKRLIIVNDNSTDKTPKIIHDFASHYEWIDYIDINSSSEHIPGSKVINAFYKGYETLDDNYDIICKFDADIIFPKDYLERILAIFKSDDKIGIAGGLPYIKKGKEWVFENIASKDHVRGPLKAYRKACFKDIAGLRRSIGWDTVDVLIAQYNGWKIKTDKDLHVKHLKPTGKQYSNETKYLQGEAFYKMRYGFLLTSIASLKNAYMRSDFSLFTNSLKGYRKAKYAKKEFMVDEKQGKFIRSYRWKGIFNRIF